MLFRQLFDSETSSYTYLIADENTKVAALVDPVLEQVNRDFNLLQELGLNLQFCLETHIHADHITGTAKLREMTGCRGVVPVNAQAVCADLFLGDGEVLNVGTVTIQAIATPGHTDSHNAYLVAGQYLLTGDSLLIRGCGRTDFQSGDAATMYQSVTQKLFTLPGTTWVYPGHDYKGFSASTINEEKKWNPRFFNQTEESFIKLMQSLHLPNPKKIMEAVPANQKCGAS